MSVSPYRRAVATATLLGAVVVAVVPAGCSSQDSDPSRTGPSGHPASNPTLVLPSAPTTTAVSVQVDLQVPSSPAIDAVLDFVHGHAESVRAGRPTARLIDVTSRDELARQRTVIGYAADRGWTVPPRPILRVVSAQRVAADREQVGVCLWLPSTEYVDATTGKPPTGTVPEAWAPAIADVRRVAVTWVIDSMVRPGTKVTMTCGSRP